MLCEEPSYAAPTISSLLKAGGGKNNAPKWSNSRVLPVNAKHDNAQHDDLTCSGCKKRIIVGDYHAHVKTCAKTPPTAVKVSDLAVLRELDANNLSACQQKALSYVCAVAKKSSDRAYPKLVERCAKLGFRASLVDQTLNYILFEAPIIVHIDLDAVLEPLLADRCLRNQFETKTSKGSLDDDHACRIKWEHRLFNGAYDDSTPFERVKYGCLNTTNDEEGVTACNQYGDSYLRLRNVRFRTTFTNKDSSDLDVKDMATAEHYAHVLNEYKDRELDAVIKVGNRLIDSLPSDTYTETYKEAQIAGKIQLNRDVEAIVVHPRHLSCATKTAQLRQFAKQNNCSLLAMKFTPPPSSP